MIEVKNITKIYGNKKVVDNVSLNIQEGKITSFIGPNGAGKSTLLSIMSRLLKRDSGEVLVDGKDILKWDNKELAKKIAILRQSNNINIRLTIRELVSFGRFPHSQGNLKEEDHKYIDEAINYMQLKEFENRYLDELSGGQRQRAYIAMVIAQNSDYIFLDEPLNNLDMKHSVEIMKILRKLCDELKKTVVIVIHDINFASCYSDYIVALKDGKLIKNGLAEETIQKEELENIYEIDFHIENINNRNICIYF
ncbi:ABC transporter ATP-binding protein [uncultured Clostridium sp.]|uniref:iron ABC transporter ATP-binding protein n=1 Tax=uncultured Clostridium sp. TaxID=59620 RepID=UPI0025D5B1D0|nr:ABC transporter ATP-binding protein [uncultured Clostridium sp.]MDU4884393.1 ABC transporter ATP-binding protein [Clostridium celatum]MDU7077591.1 ABC transporter ATP-binding protein [Clostridium celatum]